MYIGKKKKIQIVMSFILSLKRHYYFSMPEKERQKRKRNEREREK